MYLKLKEIKKIVSKIKRLVMTINLSPKYEL